MNARRAAALLEVLGVYVIGQYLVGLLIGTLRLQIENPLAHINAQMTGEELLFASRDLFFLLLLRYAGWFMLIVPINWWYRARGPSAYGLTRAGKTWKVLFMSGLATAAVAAWPVVSVQLLDRLYGLGPAQPWREALLEMSWGRWQLWVFTAVSSWGFVAFMQELFYRGYCQRRLAEDWGDGPAIIGTTCLFVFSQGEYLAVSRFNTAVLASLVVLSMAAGLIFAWTRSLLPSVVFHSIVTLLMTPRWQLLVVMACLVGSAFLWRNAAAVIRKVYSGSSLRWCLVLGAVGTAYAIFSRYQTLAVYVAAIMLGLAVALEAMQDSDRTAPLTPRPPQ